MSPRRSRPRLGAVRDALGLLTTLVGIVVFLVVGGTILWAVSLSESACVDRARPAVAGGGAGTGGEVQLAGWGWRPLGMRCVVRYADGSVERFVVNPW